MAEYCDIKQDDNNAIFEQNVYEMLKMHWFNYPQKFSLRKVKGGNTNELYLVDPNDDKHKKLLIRIYGKNTDILINRKCEEILFKELSDLQFGPKLYGIFGNGRIEQYYQNAEIHKLHKRQHYTKIAQTMAKMHCLQPVSLQNNRHSPSLWSTINKWFGIASKANLKFTDPEMQKKFEREINWKHISQRISTIQSLLSFSKKCIILPSKSNKIADVAYEFMMESVFCHNDLFEGNILYLPHLNEIKFIDFEYSSYNYRGFDFANHFCEYGIKNRFPDKQHMVQFIDIYISYLWQNGKCDNEDLKILYNDKNMYAEFLDNCVEIILIFTIMSHYFWGLWSIVMGKYSDVKHFDFMKFAYYRLYHGYNDSLKLLPQRVQSLFCNSSKL